MKGLSLVKRTLSRRGLLGSLLAAPLATACDPSTSTPRGRSQSNGRLDPDAALLRQAHDRELALLSAYDVALAAATLPSHTALVLTSVRAEHATHLQALGLPPSPAPTGTGVLPTDTAPSPTSSPGPAGTQLAKLLSTLSAAEGAAADGHQRGALMASRDLAGILAQLAASEASHPLVLR